MIDAWQCLVYELAAPLGPEASAIMAGFAIYIGCDLHLTQAGENYLEAYQEGLE